MTSIEHQRSVSLNTISALLLMIHVFANCCDVTAAINADRRDSNVKLVENNLEQQYIRLPYGAYDNDVIPDPSSPKQGWSNDEVDVSGASDDSLALQDEGQGRNEKRKWAKNTVRVWGKRNDADQFQLNEDNDETGEYPDGSKRTWSKNKVRVWGKRNMDEQNKSHGYWKMPMRIGESSAEAAIKRKWSNNKVRVWGKRGHDDEDETSQFELSSLLASASDRREKSTAKSRLPMTTTSAALYHGENSTTGKHRGLRTEASENNDVTENEDGVIDDVLRKRAAIVKRAIEGSLDSVDRLAWVPGEKPFFASDPSSPWYGEYWKSAVKRVGSVAYGGGGSSSTRLGRYPFYSAEGPKRSWRTNVIRVWGK